MKEHHRPVVAVLSAASLAVAAQLLGCASAATRPPPAPQPQPTEALEVAASPGVAAASTADGKCSTLSPIYNTKGVHSPCLCHGDACTDGCAGDRCVEKRKPGTPPDPSYPPTWVSEWTMYRVFAGYEENLPPWASPPAGLTAGKDYEVSYGATYYDDTYVPADGDGTGAMMEHYEKRCLPIFPIDNTFTCSFISLGNNAYFLTYEADRPKDMPPCCMFSPYNHPPRPDFIKHLPYSAEDSAHLDDTLQAYRYVTPAPENIWFAYAFEKDQYLDAGKKYLRPQSFYFSGYPQPPANAPFVSQTYSNFRIEKPDPKQTWDQVAATCPREPPACRLFDPIATTAGEAAPSWDTANVGPRTTQ